MNDHAHPFRVSQCDLRVIRDAGDRARMLWNVVLERTVVVLSFLLPVIFSQPLFFSCIKPCRFV